MFFVKKVELLGPGQGSAVRRSPTINRVPETLIEHWDSWGEAQGAPSLFFEMRAEAERFLAWLRARREYSPNSLHRYMVEFRKVCLHMAQRGKHVRDLTLDDYVDLRARGTVKLPEVVKLYLRYLIDATDDERYEKLYHKIRVPTKRQGLPEVLTREQLERLLAACASIDFELKVLVELLYETGARVGEVLSLRVRDVSFDELGAKVRIWRSKSESRVVRVVLYAPDLARLVEGRGPDEYIFSQHYNTYLGWLREAWRRAGLPEVSRKFHVLRHTRATEVYGEMSEKAMMLWFGWKTRKMIDVYARVKQARAEEEYLAAIGVRERRREGEAVRCPRCGSPNPASAPHCLRCGLPLGAEGQALEVASLQAQLEELRSAVEALATEVARLKRAALRGK